MESLVRLLLKLSPEFQYKAMRSRGPGGQNVNKVSSAAQLSWDFEGSKLLSEEQKKLIREKCNSNINKLGLFYVRSDESRDWPRNKQACVDKLELCLKKAFYKKPKRKSTKPSKSSKEKRLGSKSRRGELKKMRAKVRLD